MSLSYESESEWMPKMEMETFASVVSLHTMSECEKPLVRSWDTPILQVVRKLPNDLPPG